MEGGLTRCNLADLFNWFQKVLTHTSASGFSTTHSLIIEVNQPAELRGFIYILGNFHSDSIINNRRS